ERRLRREADPVEDLRVGGIRDRDREPTAALAQRDHAQLVRELAIAQVLGQRRRVDRGEVEQRMPAQLGGELRELPRRHVSAADQLVDEALLVGVGLALDGARLVQAQQLVLHERTAEPRQRGRFLRPAGGGGGHSRAIRSVYGELAGNDARRAARRAPAAGAVATSACAARTNGSPPG